MKLIFKKNENEDIVCNDNKTLSQYVISEDGLVTALDIAFHASQDIFDILEHKMVFCINFNGDEFMPLCAFIVRTADGELKCWTDFGDENFIEIVDGFKVFDNIIDAREEADKMDAILAGAMYESKKILANSINNLHLEYDDISTDVVCVCVDKINITTVLSK